MYTRKTRDIYEVQADYGYGHGFEMVTTCETYKEARQNKKEYVENDKFAKAIRIVKKRERIEE